MREPSTTLSLHSVLAAYSRKLNAVFKRSSSNKNAITANAVSAANAANHANTYT